MHWHHYGPSVLVRSKEPKKINEPQDISNYQINKEANGGCHKATVRDEVDRSHMTYFKVPDLEQWTDKDSVTIPAQQDCLMNHFIYLFWTGMMQILVTLKCAALVFAQQSTDHSEVVLGSFQYYDTWHLERFCKGWFFLSESVQLGPSGHFAQILEELIDSTLMSVH